jgi:predicted phosphodiesterase
MKIAIFSDVHANLPALEAVYKHIVAQQPDAVYCLGDLVNQNVWNNEVVEFISGHQIPCVRGNHDEGIGNNQIRFPFSYGGQDEMAWGLEAIKYTLADVTEQHKNYQSG